MNSYIFILTSFIVIFSFTINIYNIKLTEMTLKKTIIYAIVSSLIIAIIVFNNDKIAVPLYAIITFFFLEKSNGKKLINIILILLSMIVAYVADIISGLVFMNVFSITAEKLTNTTMLFLILHGCMFLISYIISKLLGLFIKKFSFDKYHIKSDNKLNLFIMINIILMAIILYINSTINKFFGANNNVIILTTILYIIYFISTITITTFYALYIRKYTDYMSKEKEYSQLKEYTDMLEHMYNDMRKFKHDYVNIISTLQGYIDYGNMDSLRTYFRKNIIPLSENINSKNTKLGLLQHIKITGLKGLLSSKVIKAQGMDIDVSIDITEDIERIDMDIIDICRIIGILFDNAIEAAEACDEGKISFGIIKNKSSIIIVIINICKYDVPPVYKLFDKGFSTKGENRGLGLNTVKDIIDKKYDNALLNTSCENGVFKQELNISFMDKLLEKQNNL